MHGQLLVLVLLNALLAATHLTQSTPLEILDAHGLLKLAVASSHVHGREGGLVDALVLGAGNTVTNVLAVIDQVSVEEEASVVLLVGAPGIVAAFVCAGRLRGSTGSASRHLGRAALDKAGADGKVNIVPLDVVAALVRAGRLRGPAGSASGHLGRALLLEENVRVEALLYVVGALVARLAATGSSSGVLDLAKLKSSEVTFDGDGFLVAYGPTSTARHLGRAIEVVNVALVDREVEDVDRGGLAAMMVVKGVRDDDLNEEGERQDPPPIGGA